MKIYFLQKKAVTSSMKTETYRLQRNSKSISITASSNDFVRYYQLKLLTAQIPMRDYQRQF